MFAIVKFLTVIIVATLAASVSPRGASAETRDCLVFHTRVNVAMALTTTTSQTFVDVPGASVDFPTDQPDTCAILEVSAQVRAADPRAVRIRVIVDGAILMEPAPIRVSTSQNKVDQRTFRFVLRDIAQGSHVAQVQFLSSTGAAVSVGKLIITVNYNELG